MKMTHGDSLPCALCIVIAYARSKLQPRPRAEALDNIRARLREAMQGIPTPRLQALQMWFGLDGREPMTLRAIAAKLGRSVETIRVRIRKALKEIRKRPGGARGIEDGKAAAGPATD